MAPSPAPRSTTPQGWLNPSRTPTTPRLKPTPHRLGAPSPASLLPLVPSEHPVEVVGRIREHPEGVDKLSAIQIIQNGQALRVKTDQGYRDFSFDGVSLAESEDLHEFYKKYVEARIHSVKLGGRCTIMMYGPTGAGKSRTMFGSAKEPGIAYRALQHIMGNPHTDTARENGDSPGLSLGRTKVNVTVLEVYNEEIFDLLASNTVTDRSRPNAYRVRLEVMGKKAKNAVSISGSDADKVTREIAKVEKRRVVKSTHCNERSSRSHCMVTLDVPSIGGRLVLVDMAGSENIDQAGVGTETKLQTGKINQGNVALKRVVEAIANGDSYIPFRDSKLTMLLQDSFEDDRAKILMVLCASPDSRDIHKTIGTLEYGAKAKCIIRLPVSPAREKPAVAEETELTMLEERIRAMDDYIAKLQQETRLKDREKEGIDKEVTRREQELADLRERIKEMEREREGRGGKELEGHDTKIRLVLERKLVECQNMVDDFLKFGERKLEEHILRQQNEIDWMHTRMQEIENTLKNLQEIECIKVVPRGDDGLSKIKEQVDGDVMNKSREILQQVELSEAENQQKIERKFSQDQFSDNTTESNSGSDKIYKIERGCSDDHMLVGRYENSCGLIGVQTTELCRPQVACLSDQTQSSTLAVCAHSLSLSCGSHVAEESGVIFTKEECKEFPGFQSTSSLGGGNSDPEGCGVNLVSSRRGVSNHTVYSPANQVANQSQYPHNFEFRTSGDLFSKDSSDDSEDTFYDVGHGEFERTGWLPMIPEESEEGEERLSDDNDEMYMDKHVETVTASVNLEEADKKVKVRQNLETGSTLLSRLFVYDGKQGQALQELKNTRTCSDLATPGCAQLATPYTFMRKAVESEIEKEGTFGDWSYLEREDLEMIAGGEIKEHHTAAAARRSRIENIFLLCGNHRELAAHKPIKKPVQMSDSEARFSIDGNLAAHSVTSLQSESIDYTDKDNSIISAYSSANSKTSVLSQFLADPLSTCSTTGSVRDMDISPVISDFQVPSIRSESATSENIPPCEMVAGQKSMSPRKLFVAASLPTSSVLTSADMKENQVSTELDNAKCDVYVKWETARDTSRKLIHIIKITKNANLAELRKAIEPHLPDMNQEFTFLMLGDPSGAPVERDKEAILRVSSLPDCHNQKGSRLACLRTPFRRTLTTGPFRAMENQISSNSKLAITEWGQTVTSIGMNLQSSEKAGSCNSGMAGKTNQKLNIQSGSQVKGLRL